MELKDLELAYQIACEVGLEYMSPMALVELKIALKKARALNNNK